MRGIALALALPFCSWLGIAASGFIVDARGVAAGCVSLATSKGAAIGVLATVLIIATAAAALIGRLVNAVVGMFVVGAALAALSMRSGAFDAVIFDSGDLNSLGLETLLWTLPAALATLAVFLASGPLPDVPRRYDDGPWWREYFDFDALRVGLVGTLMLLVVWLIVRNMMKGQALGGACLGGIAVGMAYRMIAPQVQPVVAFITPILFLGVGEMLVSRQPPLTTELLFTVNEIAPQTRVMPLDAVAGSFIGVAIGIGWARSFRKTDTIPS